MGRTADRPAGGPTGGARVLDSVLARLEPGWRIDNPKPGSAIADDIRLYHDADARNVAIARIDDGLRLTVYQFRGSYLSLAVGVPGHVRARLRTGWRLIVGLTAEATRPITTFVRLNMGHRQGNGVLHEVLVVAAGARTAAFEPVASQPEWSSAWLDIIFSHPRMTEIDLCGLNLEFEEMP